MKKLKYFKTDIISLLLDRSCPVCQAQLNITEEVVCAYCLSEIESIKLQPPIGNEEVYQRLCGRFPLAGAFSLYYYDKGGKLQLMVNQLKYHQNYRMGTTLGELIAYHLAKLPWTIDAILPVPLSKSRMKKRGFNQAEAISKGISAKTSIPVHRQLLSRTYSKGSQTNKNLMERWKHVQESFSASTTFPENVLLVDDIITSGATLEACAKAIFKSETPPSKLYVASIGLTRKS